ncbi:LCP family protein [Intestinimonas timonensis]|uniref:LCP family protein n=1 Tax=Intestinimonas timonensis TaxID=1689270 RepID=UPI00102F5DFE|nr:LCP family protein [Intestinimonas timonensis]
MAKRLIKKKKKRRGSPLGRMFRTLYRTVVVLSALIVVFFCAYKALVKPPEQAAPPTVEVPQPTDVTDDPNTDEDESALPTPTPLVRKDGFYTFLLAATDEGGGNTDTIMVVGYDTANQEMGVVSIPRDTLVDRKIPKINSVYASDGIDGLKDVVSDLIGIPIDHYVTVNLNGFQRLVNAVGGVDFYVPCDMNYDDPTADPPLSIHYSEGMTHLDGQEAMEVVRFRHNNDGSGYTDVGRSQTQQQLLIAVGKKVLANPGNITEYVDIFLKNVKTDLSATDIIWLATQAASLDLDNGVSTATLPGDGTVRYRGTSWCYQLEPEECLEIFNTMLNPYTTEITMDMTNMLQVS